MHTCSAWWQSWRWFPPKKEVPEDNTVSAREAVRPSNGVPTSKPELATTAGNGSDASRHQVFHSRPPSDEDSDVVNENTSSSRKWLWILAGLAVVFFFYHFGGRGRVKSQVFPTVQTRISEAEKGLQSSPPPIASETQNPAPQGSSDALESRCSRFKAQLPENYDIYAAGGYARPGSHRSNELNSGVIDVYINRPGKKVLLILGADESVTWNIKDSGSTQIVGVVLSGRLVGMLDGLPPQIPVLHSAYENGAPCGYFVGEADAMQSVYPFASQLLTRAVDEIAAPRLGRVDFGIDRSKTIVLTEPERSIIAPHGIHCDVPNWNSPPTSCSGQILASGTMNNSDYPADAARNCEKTKVAASCCMYHLYGIGKWYLTDGKPQSQGRDCEVEPSGNRNSCYAGGPCTAN